jgi:hypothetical protein
VVERCVAASCTRCVYKPFERLEPDAYRRGVESGKVKRGVGISGTHCKRVAFEKLGFDLADRGCIEGGQMRI